MKPKPWKPPTPTLETAHDVRRLRVCDRCGAMGSDLLRASNLFQNRKAFVHAYCLISKQRDGWDVFTAMPSEEIGKITMSEWKALGIPYTRIEEAYEAARRREKKASVVAETAPSPKRVGPRPR